MQKWYLAQCHNKHFDRIVQWVSALGVTCYYPIETRVTARKDCSSVRVTQKPLLPGYLFTQFDPLRIHPTKITDIPGVHAFVRFGGEACIVGDDVIEALKQVRILSIAAGEDDAVGCTNISPTLLSAIKDIYALHCPQARQVAFMHLLTRRDVADELLAGRSRIYSSVSSVSR